MKSTPNQVSTHGGKRPGAGRKPGSRPRATDGQKETLSALARTHTKVAISTLVRVASKSQSDSAAVAAASALLDRGYGKPPQTLEHGGELTIKHEDALAELE